MNHFIRTDISNAEIKEVSQRWQIEMLMRSIYCETVLLQKFLEKFRYSPHLDQTECLMVTYRMKQFDQVQIPAFSRLFINRADIFKSVRSVELFKRLQYVTHCVNMLTTLIQNKPKNAHVHMFSKDDWNVEYKYWRFKTFDWN